MAASLNQTWIKIAQFDACWFRQWLQNFSDVSGELEVKASMSGQETQNRCCM
jgi:hypothetical protein